MAQINLLTSDAKQPSNGGGVVSIAAKVLIAILILAVVWYGYLFISVNRTGKDIENTKNDIAQAQSSILADQGRAELLTRQSQLKDATNLISGHIYWSNLFDELPKSTLQGVSYRAITTTHDGTVTVEFSVPSYEDLDKFLQVFDLPEYNKNFSNIKLLSISKAQEGSSLQIAVKMQLTFNTAALKKI